jgi:DNA-damage-inducible protein J
MAISQTIIRSRIDPTIKNKAEKVLGSMGLTMSDAIRIFLHQVVIRKALPFPVQAPNAKTTAAMKAAAKGKGLRKVTLDQLRKEWNAS